MPIVTLQRRPELPPIAPKAVDRELLQRLLSDRTELHALAVVLVPRCQFLQRAITRGIWYSRKDLSATQRMCRTALKAAHGHRDLGRDTLAALDRLQGFCEGHSLSAEVAA